MVRIDSMRCTGCGTCVDVCPRQAISIDNDVAVINEEACVDCGACATICPTGAIHELAPVSTRLSEGGERMYYGYGRGLGFGGSSPPWPYVGRGRGGLPRCQYPGAATFPRYRPASLYATQMTREQELDLLKGQAEAIKRELGQVEARIRDLEVNK